MPDHLAQPQQPGEQQPPSSSDPARNDLGLAMLRHLAQGQPVELDTLASDTRRPVDEIRSELKRHGDIEYDQAGRIVGNGITLRPTPHRFEIDGRELYTWCALDTLVCPAMLGVCGRVQSPCHATGQPIPGEDALRERLASQAPEIAAKLRPPKRRGVRRRTRA